ncbi:copper amine oxidase N-terminal domain-containing protein (plasmid) [Brevibacillus halotolerans]|nr:copper amine oxidase N-terminal domain-containing protein [Brevibacillus halotolerans]
MENAKKHLFNWRTLAVAVIVGMLVVLSTIAGNTTTLYVNGKDVTKQGEPTYRAGVLYLPLESVVSGMGDSFTWVTEPRVANVKTKSGKEVTITIAKSVVMVDGKSVPISSLELQDAKVPMQAKPVIVNSMLYVPYDFFKSVLGYPVEIKKNGSKENIIVGQGVPVPTPVPLPTKPITIDPRYPLPAGWTPPQLSSSWTSDKQKNMQILEEELGFKNLGAGAVYYGIGLGTDAILLSAKDYEQIDTRITIKYWNGDKNTPYANKIPYISRELFHFYLSNQGDQLWKIMDDGYSDKDISKYVDKKFTLGDREIKIMDLEDGVVIFMGKPGVKYDSNWKIIK